MRAIGFLPPPWRSPPERLPHQPCWHRCPTPAATSACERCDVPMSQSSPTASPPEPVSAGVPQRLCGRCRLSFPLEASVTGPASDDWWLCPSCAATLLGGR